MREELARHIGSRIRHYRKARGLTIDDLANRIHKSKGSVSKYESGQISVDVATLFEIAQALMVDPIQLLTYPLAAGPKPHQNFRNPFGITDVLYMYHMKTGKIYKSVIRLWRDRIDGETRATLYYVVEDFDNTEKCECIYEGKMHTYNTVLCYTLQNYLNPAENLLLNFTIPMKRFSALTGLACGLGADTLTPTCILVAISAKPILSVEKLREMLSIPPDSIKNLKKHNMLTFYPKYD